MAPKAFQYFFFIFLFSLVLPLSSLANPSNPNPQKPSPFEFIKHLQGCQKGEKVKGLHQLKIYLENFGYLNYQKSQNQTLAKDNDFDDLLESAIKTYQLNYDLKVTGILDAQTVSMMTAPRCGFPDIVNGTNFMRSAKKMTHQYYHNTFHTVSHFSFFPGTPKWPASQTHLTYGFQPGTNTNAIGAVVRAFNQWAAATHFSFSQTQDFRGANLKIGFHRRDHGDGFPFDGPSGTLAHAFAPTDGRFHFDADESWVVGAVNGSFDIKTVAMHEIGHLLGLGHSAIQEAIMYASIAPGVTRSLHEDDIQGIKTLYNNVQREHNKRSYAIICFP